MKKKNVSCSMRWEILFQICKIYESQCRGGSSGCPFSFPCRSYSFHSDFVFLRELQNISLNTEKKDVTISVPCSEHFISQRLMFWWGSWCLLSEITAGSATKVSDRPVSVISRRCNPKANHILLPSPHFCFCSDPESSFCCLMKSVFLFWNLSFRLCLMLLVSLSLRQMGRIN